MKPGVQAGMPPGGPAPRGLSAAMKKGVFPAETPIFHLAISFSELLISGSYGISGRVILAVRS
jgi:hypothetical protein